MEPQPLLHPFSTDTTNQLMCGTNLETTQVVLLDDVSVMRASVLAVERDRGKGGNFGFFDPPKRAPPCGFTTRTSRGHYTVCTHRAVKAL